jgi:hypothetical protein
MSLLPATSHANQTTPFWAKAGTGGRSVTGNNAPIFLNFGGSTAETITSLTFTPDSVGTVVVMAYGNFNNGSTNPISATLNIQSNDDSVGLPVTCLANTRVATSPVYTRNVGEGSPITIDLIGSISGSPNSNITVDATWTVMFFKS